jgi:hypothetical protein
MATSYDVTATVHGVDNTLITSTSEFNHALKAKQWAIEQGYDSVHLHKLAGLMPQYEVQP